MVRQLPRDHVAGRIQVGAAMVRDHALGVSGGPRGVVQRNRIPFVCGQLPGKVGAALGQKVFVADFAQPLARRRFAVFNFDDKRPLVAHHGQRLFDDAGELAVDDQDMRLAVLQHEGNGLRIEPGVQRVEHRARHGHAEMDFEHGRHVGQHDRHGMARADAARAQRMRQLAAAVIGLFPGLALRAVNDGGTLWIDPRGSLDVAQGRKRHEIGRIFVQPELVRSHRAHRCLLIPYPGVLPVSAS